MSHLGNAINRLMLERPQLTAAEVARKTRVSTAYISRLRTGERKGISPEVLTRLAAALADTRAERAELIAAHMKDESCGYYPEFIAIRILSGNKRGNKSNQKRISK
jgi:transcriptional regulator with XRE-family HTH domain